MCEPKEAAFILRVHSFDNFALESLQASVSQVESGDLPEGCAFVAGDNINNLLVKDPVKRHQDLNRLVGDREFEALIELVRHHHQVHDDLLLAQ